MPLEFPHVPNDCSSEQRQILLNEALEMLSGEQFSTEDQFCDAAEFFNDLYSDGSFRHSYAEVFRVMVGDGVEAQRLDERCSCLSENMSLLVGHCSEKCSMKNGECSIAPVSRMGAFRKLQDHVNLEARRISSDNEIRRQAEASANTLGDKIASLAEEVEDKNKKIDALKESLEKATSEMTKDYIAILGIFSAVVIFANSGVVFSSSAINAIAGQSVVSIAFIVSLVGAVVFNVLFCLFSFIQRLSSKNCGWWSVMSRQAFMKVNRVLLAVIAVLFIASIAMEIVSSGSLAWQDGSSEIAAKAAFGLQ